MNFEGISSFSTRRSVLIRTLYSGDNEASLEALQDIKEAGWLNDSSFRGVNLAEATLAEADLKNVDLKGAYLKYANLQNANLQSANLIETDLEAAKLNGANLQKAKLQEAVLYHCTLISANLTKCNLSGTMLVDADLTNAKLNDANLAFADLSGAAVSDMQLRSAYRLGGAFMPDESTYNGCFNLAGDLHNAGINGVDQSDASAMASFYGVTVENYLTGQKSVTHRADSKKSKQVQVKESEPTAQQEGSVVKIALSNVSSYFKFISWPFQDRRASEQYLDDAENRHIARTMAGYAGSTLLWLPQLLIGLSVCGYYVVTNIRYQLRWGLPIDLWDFLSFNIVDVGPGMVVWSLIGWYATAKAAAATSWRAWFGCAIAGVFGLLFIPFGSVSGLLAVGTGFVIAMLNAYVYGSRLMRNVFFIIGGLLITSGFAAVILRIVPQGFESIFETDHEFAIRFLLVVCPLALVSAYLLAWWLWDFLQTKLLPYIGMRRESRMGYHLLIGYGMVFSLVVGETIIRLIWIWFSLPII